MRSISRATALTVLQATTSILIPWASSARPQARAYRMIVAGLRVPYGTRAVSPR